MAIDHPDGIQTYRNEVRGLGDTEARIETLSPAAIPPAPTSSVPAARASVRPRTDALTSRGHAVIEAVFVPMLSPFPATLASTVTPTALASAGTAALRLSFSQFQRGHDRGELLVERPDCGMGQQGGGEQMYVYPADAAAPQSSGFEETKDFLMFRKQCFWKLPKETENLGSIP